MPRGGPRVGAGRPKKGEARAANPSSAAKTSKAPEQAKPQDVDRRVDSASEQVTLDPLPCVGNETPLQYMVRVMNDAGADEVRRDRLAVAAAPYLHPKVGESGKKEQKASAAKTAGGGKFAPSAPPRLVSSR